MKSFEQKVADWARAKPADEAYDYGDFSNCALAQFLQDSGFAQKPRCGGDYWRGDDGLAHPLDERVRMALVRDPNTFGALADRLSA